MCPLILVLVVVVAAVVACAAALLLLLLALLPLLTFFFFDDDDVLLFLRGGEAGATSTQSPGASVRPFMNLESSTAPEAACMCVKSSIFKSSPHKSCTSLAYSGIVIVVSLLLDCSSFRFCCSSSVMGASLEKIAPKTVLKESCKEDGSDVVAGVVAFSFLFSFAVLKLVLSFSNALDIFPLVALRTSAFPLTTSRSLSKSVTMMYRSISPFSSASSLFMVVVLEEEVVYSKLLPLTPFSLLKTLNDFGNGTPKYCGMPLFRFCVLDAAGAGDVLLARDVDEPFFFFCVGCGCRTAPAEFEESK